MCGSKLYRTRDSFSCGNLIRQSKNELYFGFFYLHLLHGHLALTTSKGYVMDTAVIPAQEPAASVNHVLDLPGVKKNLANACL